MGCSSSSQKPAAAKYDAGLPSLLNAPQTGGGKVSFGPGKVSFGPDNAGSGGDKRLSGSIVPSSTVPRQTRCSVWAAIDERDGIEQIAKEEASDVLLLVAKEADEMDQATKPMIALVSHDNMKPLMAAFAKSYDNYLSNFRLTGTGTTCKVLRSIGLEPEDHDVPSGPLGGDQVLGAMICRGDIRALFFFQDPLSSHAHAADISALSRLCNVYQIYFATNYRSAGAILQQLNTNIFQRQRGSVLVPDGMSTDLGQAVQKKYKETRELAIAAAVAAEISDCQDRA
jgi:methylglyoxal synthase